MLSPAFRPPRALVGAALCVAAAFGCSDPEPEPLTGATIALLARDPDIALQQPGRIAVDPETLWSPYGRGGWNSWSDTLEDGTHFVWSSARHARLRLDAVAATDRTIRLRAFAPTGDREKRRGMRGQTPEFPTVDVKLNGQVLDSVLLSSEARDYELAAPASAWIAGENVIELSVDVLTSVGPDAWLGLGLASVEYGEPRALSFDAEARSAELSPDTGLRYLIELLAPGELVLSGTAEGTGALEVRLARFDPATAALEPILEAPLRIPPRSGRLAASIPLRELRDGVLSVELVWRGDASSSLTLTGADVVEAEEVERMPIVLVSIDTLAARHMSLFGYERETTPHLDELASESIVFDRAKSNAPRTLQSYLSKLTGLYPMSHRDLRGEEGIGKWLEIDRLAPSRWTLAEMLRAAGYATGAFVDNPWITHELGFDQGFETFDTSAAELPHWNAAAFDPRGGIWHILPRFESWLDGLPAGAPFFAFLQPLDVHGPYIPVEPWAGRFRPEREEGDTPPLLEVGAGQTDVFGVIPEYIARGEIPEGELPDELPTDVLIAKYDEKVLEMDAAVGSLVESLRERGVLDDAVLIVTADHGESMLEHGYFFDHGTLYEEAIHVPLLVRLPGGKHGGRRIAEPIQLVDLYPTIADLAGLDADRGYLHGRSLVPALTGASKVDVRPILAEGGVMTQSSIEHDGWKLIEMHPWEASYQTRLSDPRVDRDLLARIPELNGDEALTNREIYAIFEARPKLLGAVARELRGPFIELYHLAEDPGELVDLADAHPEKVAELSALLEQERQRVVESRRRGAFVSSLGELSPDALGQLESLGYLGAEDLQR